MKKIILLGYMGSGKSTIAKLLSKAENIPCQDLDEVIEKELNLSVADIFKQKGEVYFRKLENKFLEKLLNSNENMIMSLGGGTPCYSNNQELLKEKDIITIYLKTSIEKLFDRLNNQKENRPLIAHLNEEEMKEFIAKHLFERSFFYNQANHTLLTDNKTPEQIVSEIQTVLV